ncbi:MAG: phosphoenolpyruvate synthase [Neisseriales bacterium]|nr:MAG: phosphoenolpyruvate synthase [Neisseriales bacterium]
MMADFILWLSQLRATDTQKVGGKNSSLGEMISQLAKRGVKVPDGFATTAQAFEAFLAQNHLDQRIQEVLSNLDVDDIAALNAKGKTIRQWILDTPFPEALENAIDQAWQRLVNETDNANIAVAVRSSATAEDLPDASFAGQQETFLNIRGLMNVKEAIKHVFASLYNDRAIAYRIHQGFEHSHVAISAGIQRMVRSDLAASGVMFTLDTESGFQEVVFITASYGLGETVVQGSVNPDEFYVHKHTLEKDCPAILRKTIGTKLTQMIFSKTARVGHSVEVVDVPVADQQRFCITENEIETLARYALIIEKHYGCPMDIEWGKDGEDGQIYILQARPETVKSRQQYTDVLRRYQLKNHSQVLVEGRAIGQKIGQGTVRVLRDINQMATLKSGDILVTGMTDPDWEPIMKRAAAIITDRGGRTCHAAIIARELGIPAVLGCGNATQRLKDGESVTVSCAEGDVGKVYQGLLDIDVVEVTLNQMPAVPVKLTLNMANPELAFEFCQLPHEGAGLVRIEFMIARQIGIHPNALLDFEQLPSDLQAAISARIIGYENPTEFYVKKLTEGIATIAAAMWPKPVIVRCSDFKTNEYVNLLAGNRYEPHEENPMIGFRGAARYLSPAFRPCFEMECRALKYVRDTMCLTNVQIMIPFVRSVKEATQVIELLAKNGLVRGENDLKLIMMCEIPTNALLAEQFLAHFDGFSIGSNDMTQLALGIDRDSGSAIAASFDERDDGVKALLHMAIQACKQHQKYVGICGQGPSDHPDMAKWLVEEGIDTISLNPDTVIKTWLYLADTFKK